MSASPLSPAPAPAPARCVSPPTTLACPAALLPRPRTIGILVLARHGQSEYNKSNVFTGSDDPPLSAEGRREAHRMTRKLIAQGYTHFDAVYVSDMQRCEQTLQIQLSELGIDPDRIPTVRTARLRERDYGDITGCNKEATAEKYGTELVNAWRRSWSVAPPHGESLQMTAERVMPLYEAEILPRLKQGQSVLVTSHGNTLRALCKVLEGMDEETIRRFQIGEGVVIIFQLQDGQIVRRHILE